LEYTFTHFNVIILLFVSILRPTRNVYMIPCLKHICRYLLFWKCNSYWQYWYVYFLPHLCAHLTHLFSTREFAPRNLDSFAHSEIWTYGCCPLWFISSLFTRVLYGFFLSKSVWLYSPITNA